MTVRVHRSQGWTARHEIVLYLALAYVISWSIWPLVLLNPESSPLVPFGPGLAAVLVAFMAGGRPGLFGLLRQLGRWRVNPAWYGVALGVPLAVPGLALAAAVIAGAPVPRWELRCAAGCWVNGRHGHHRGHFRGAGMARVSTPAAAARSERISGRADHGTDVVALAPSRVGVGSGSASPGTIRDLYLGAVGAGRVAI